MKLYYKIWVDCITKMQSIPANRDSWKFMSLSYMTIAMALDIGLILSVIQLHIVGSIFYDIKFDIFPGEKLDNALSFLTLYFAIPLSFNYLLIFRNNRYEMLIRKYESNNGKSVSIFFFGSLLINFLYMLFQ